MNDWRAFLLGGLTTLSILVVLVGYEPIFVKHRYFLVDLMPAILGAAAVAVVVWSTRKQLNQKEAYELDVRKSKQRASRAMLAPVLSEIIGMQRQRAKLLSDQLTPHTIPSIGNSMPAFGAKTPDKIYRNWLRDATPILATATEYADPLISRDLSLLVEHLQIQSAREERDDAHLSGSRSMASRVVPIAAIYARAERLLFYSRGEMNEFNNCKLKDRTDAAFFPYLNVREHEQVKTALSSETNSTFKNWFADPICDNIGGT